MKRWLWILYLVISLINYVLFLWVLPSSLVPYFQYAGIIGNGFFALRIGYKQPSKGVLILALFGTMVADLFLLFPGGNRILGTAVFVVVQGLYGWFLIDLLVSNQEGKIWKWGRAMGSLVILLVAWWISPEEIRLLLMVGGLYGVQLLFNVALALRLWKQVPWMAFGMVMFLGCDGLVALSSIQAYLPTSLASLPLIQVYFASSFPWIWFFYYPSQFFLVMTVVQPLKKKTVHHSLVS